MSSKPAKPKKLRVKTKRFKTVQQKVKLFRAREPFISVFMWGINHSVNELSHVNIPVMLMPDDFKAFTKVRIDNHLFNKENMPSHFKVKEYCPLVFRNLRERFSIDESDYCHSLTKEQPVDMDSPGRSGARFMVSTDRRFCVKTVGSEEIEQMHNILQLYHQHVVEFHGETLLPQFLGMYRLTVHDTEHYLIVMRNVFSKRFPPHAKYDLKGSTVDRTLSEKERAKAKGLPTLKDNDFLQQSKVIAVGETQKVALMEKLRRDVKFLSSHNVMDYSLLVGIHDVARGQEEGELEEGEGEDEEYDSAGSGGAGMAPDAPNVGAGAAATPPDSPPAMDVSDPLVLDPTDESFGLYSAPGHMPEEIYFMGIIDTLTSYGVKKRTASLVKSAKHGSDAEFSTVKPEHYAQRFLEFIDKCLR